MKSALAAIKNKTDKPVRFEITETIRQHLDRWIVDPEIIGLESGEHGCTAASRPLRLNSAIDGNGIFQTVVELAR